MWFKIFIFVVFSEDALAVALDHTWFADCSVANDHHLDGDFHVLLQHRGFLEFSLSRKFQRSPESNNNKKGNTTETQTKERQIRSNRRRIRVRRRIRRRRQQRRPIYGRSWRNTYGKIRCWSREPIFLEERTGNTCHKKYTELLIAAVKLEKEMEMSYYGRGNLGSAEHHYKILRM